MIIRVADGVLRTEFGEWSEILFYDGQTESIALVMGEIKGKEEVLCRVHSNCITAHVFNSVECDCREQMRISQNMIQTAGCGLIIWLDQEGKGNGHLALVATSGMRREGMYQTEAFEKIGFPADDRSYRVAAEIIDDLEVRSVRLLTNSPAKVDGLRELGVAVSGMENVIVDSPLNTLLKQTYDGKRAAGHQID